jgi:hypothetical protein
MVPSVVAGPSIFNPAEYEAIYTHGAPRHETYAILRQMILFQIFGRLNGIVRTPILATPARRT